MAAIDYEKLNEKMCADSAVVLEALRSLNTIGTPQSQQMPDYKNLILAIENLGALHAVLENKRSQIQRRDEGWYPDE